MAYKGLEVGRVPDNYENRNICQSCSFGPEWHISETSRSMLTFKLQYF